MRKTYTETHTHTPWILRCFDVAHDFIAFHFHFAIWIENTHFNVQFPAIHWCFLYGFFLSLSSPFPRFYSFLSYDCFSGILLSLLSLALSLWGWHNKSSSKAIISNALCVYVLSEKWNEMSLSLSLSFHGENIVLIFCSCAMASSKLKIATSLRIYERVERQQLSKQVE